MGIKEATIYLDNQWNTYYAGQTVNGRIEYEFDSPETVRGVYVKFKGGAYISWHEKKTRDEDDKTQHMTTTYQSDEEYLNEKYYILGSETGDEIEIPPGKHVYKFTCTLPPTLPTSFESKFGYVRYTVKVVLDRSLNFDQETKMAFTVINRLDLNLNREYRNAVHIQLEKTFCCLCCASAPLSVDVRAPVSGYCAGQTIPIEIHVENKSDVQLHLVKIYLRRVVTYEASSTKKTKHEIAETRVGPLPANTTKHWSRELKIPPLPPSTLVNCIINLKYQLKVECEVPWPHLDIDDKTYITIGTVPLVDGAGPPAAVDGRPTATPPGGPGQPVAQPTLPEPIFKESTDTARTIQDRNDSPNVHIVGPSNFAPRYPTYDEVQPPPLPR